MQQEANMLLRNGKRIAFVPTMGCLHEGHLALMREGRKRGDVLVVSIFVNPTQFGPHEDLQAYPRDMDRDVRLCESVGVDIVFTPESDDMYDQRNETYVNLGELPRYLCGPSRPGHFRGVATVVAKLFNMVKPQVALLGEKDYQQLLIIRRMVQDLNMDVQIVAVPTVRESDGLAMSSRNSYLSEEERHSALALYKSLQLARQRVSDGIRNSKEIVEEISELISSHPHTKKDYVALCDPETLRNVKRVDKPSLLALAVWVGKTRLIDNTVLTP
jgi:pantoate--beta-alanine ligase